jgi:hypothetical protein
MQTVKMFQNLTIAIFVIVLFSNCGGESTSSSQQTKKSEKDSISQIPKPSVSSGSGSITFGKQKPDQDACTSGNDVCPTGTPVTFTVTVNGNSVKASTSWPAGNLELNTGDTTITFPTQTTIGQTGANLSGTLPCSLSNNNTVLTITIQQ